jgi:predicted double-glycine peptidase
MKILALALMASTAFAQQLPDRFLKVPILPQASRSSSAAASLASVLHYWRVFDGGEGRLRKIVDAPSIAAEARRHHLSATVTRDADVRAALAAGQTAIVQAHRRWVVLIGADESFAYVMDPDAAGGYEWLPFGELDASSAILIAGKTPLQSVPAPLGYMDWKARPAPPMPANFLPVPLVRQATSWSCGAAALEAVLYYWRVFDGPEDELWSPLHATPRDGTEPFRIAALARERFGLRAEYKTDVTLDQLRRAIGERQTVIVDLEAWADDKQPREWASDWDDGHYVVAVAIDDANLYVMDPSTAAGYAFLTIDDFLARWHDVEVKKKVQHMAIFIAGKTPLQSMPAPLRRLDASDGSVLGPGSK